MAVRYRQQVILLGLALLVGACAPLTPEETVNRANERYAEQDYDSALSSYLNVQSGFPEMPAPYYNAANVYYRQSDFQAAQLYLQEAALRGDAALDQAAYYNLGNVAFNSEDLATAVEQYKAALRLNPSDADAKHNLELALQALEEQLQQEQEQQQQQDQQQEEEQQQEDQQNEQPEQDEQEGAQDGEGEQEDGGTPTPDPESEQPQPTPEQPDESQNEGEGEPTEQPTAEPSPAGQDDQSENEGESEGDDQQGATPTPDAQGDQQQPGSTPTVPPTATPPDAQPDPSSGAGEQQPLNNEAQLAMPTGGQQLDEDQARQLLTAIGRQTETLQERLQQIYVAPGGPPAEDW